MELRSYVNYPEHLAPATSWAGRVVHCSFCHRQAAGVYAVTSLGSAEDGDDWRRGVAPLRPRCYALLRQAGAEGRRLKASGERW